MTDRQREIRDRLAAVTPGPWVVGEEVDGVYAGRRTVVRYMPPDRYSTRIVSIGQTRGHDSQHAEANIEFIANAPADISWLLAEIERLSATCGALLWPGRDNEGPCILPVDHLAGHRSLRPDGQPVGWSTASLGAIIGLDDKR